MSDTIARADLRGCLPYLVHLRGGTYRVDVRLPDNRILILGYCDTEIEACTLAGAVALLVRALSEE